MKLVRKLRSFFLRFGLREGSLRLLGALMDLIYCRRQLVFMVKPTSTLTVCELPDGVEARALCVADLGTLSGAMYVDESVVRQRLENGDCCALIIVDGRIASSIWILTRYMDVPALQLRIPLCAGMGFLDTLTTESHVRRQGYGRMAASYVTQLALQHDLSLLTGAIDVRNHPSRALFKKMGCQEFKIITMVRILGWRRYSTQILLQEFGHLLDF